MVKTLIVKYNKNVFTYTDSIYELKSFKDYAIYNLTYFLKFKLTEKIY